MSDKKVKHYKTGDVYWETGHQQTYHEKSKNGKPSVALRDNTISPVVVGSRHDRSHVKNKDQSRLDVGPKKSKQKDDF